MIKKAEKSKKPKLGTVAKKIIINKKILFIIFFTLLYTVFFIFIHNQLLFTPDFGASDSYHFNLSLKYFLAKQIKNNHLPFWTDKLSAGFPVLAEAQIGSLFFPNIVFLKFFDFVYGYNLLLIFSLFSFTIGSFFLFCELKINYLLAFFLSIILTFNGAIAFRWVHLNLVQTFSFYPWLIFFLFKLKDNKKYGILFSILLSQMIFAGHFQTVFIALFSLIVFWLTYLFFQKKPIKKAIRQILFLIFLILSGILFSLPQILSTYNLSKLSNRGLFLDYDTTTSFPLNWINLINFFNPYFFGNPKNGTYPPFSSSWGIFWENTPYVGGIFFALFIFSLILSYKKRLIPKDFYLYFFLSLFFLFIALGKNSFLYFIYNFPPFNFFRTPSKFLLITNFFLIFSFSVIINQLFNKSNLKVKILIVFFLILSISQLLLIVFQYHLFLPAKSVLSSPEIANYIKNNQMILSLGQEDDWNTIFIRSGWDEKKDINGYLFLKNFLYPNSNLLFDKKIFGVNTGGLKIKRVEYINELIKNQIKFNNQEIFISDNLNDFFDVLGIKYIISPKKINSHHFYLKKKLKDHNFSIYLYERKNSDFEIFYIPKYGKKIEYLNDFMEKILAGKVSEENAFVEDYQQDFMQNELPNIKEIKANDTSITIEGDFKSKTLLVFRKNYFPSWEAFLDGKKTKIYKTNLIQMGIFIPQGQHKIKLQFKDQAFILGAILSLIYLPVFLLIINKLKSI